MAIFYIGGFAMLMLGLLVALYCIVDMAEENQRDDERRGYYD